MQKQNQEQVYQNPQRYREESADHAEKYLQKLQKNHDPFQMWNAEIADHIFLAQRPDDVILQNRDKGDPRVWNTVVFRNLIQTDGRSGIEKQSVDYPKYQMRARKKIVHDKIPFADCFFVIALYHTLNEKARAALKDERDGLFFGIVKF